MWYLFCQNWVDSADVCVRVGEYRRVLFENATFGMCEEKCTLDHRLSEYPFKFHTSLVCKDSHARFGLYRFNHNFVKQMNRQQIFCMQAINVARGFHLYNNLNLLFLL